MLYRWLRFTALACGIAYGQQREFEVASVKYVGPWDDEKSMSQRGGPGTSDPTHIFCENIGLLTLLSRAYGLSFEQISGPKWLDSVQYTIIANLPPGTTKDDLPKMWQRLLEERFHLAVHHVPKDFPVYELVVAKNGPKLKASAGDPGKRVPGSLPTHGEDGFPVLPPGSRHAFFQPMENGVHITRETFRDYSMQELVQELAWPLGAPSSWDHVISVGRIVDKTGLTGKYDFKLQYEGMHNPGGAFPPPGPDGQVGSAPTLFNALQQQLGLKLQESKAPFDVLVVDHVDRIPTEN